MMMILLVQTALLLSSCMTYGIAQTMSCEGAVGEKPTTLYPSPPKNLSGLFLNTHPDSRAPCNGKVVAWDFCYYVLDDTIPQQKNDSIRIQAGVWRQQDNSEYQFLKSSSIKLPIPSPMAGFQFVCRYWSLVTNNATFEVEEGDIVGVYVDDTRMVHVLGNSTNDAEDNGIVRAVNITDIEMPVSMSELNSTSFSLYLKAIMENSTCTCPDLSITPSPTINTPSTVHTPATTTSTLSTMTTVYDTDPTIATTMPLHTPSMTTVHTPAADNIIEVLESWKNYVIGGLAAVVFLLVITIIATICGLIYLHKRNKGSEPVLIKKMKTGKQKKSRILMISQEPAAGLHTVSTESEPGDRDSSPHRSQHPTAQPHQPAPTPLPNTVGSQMPPEKGELTAPMSPPPIVFAASFDIEQLSDDDQGRFKPNRQKPTHTKAKKIALVPSSDLRRSYSAADALNVAYSTSSDANSCAFTASTEYPYVLHAFEVVGRHKRSLPNIIEHRFLEDQATNPEEGNHGGTANFQMDTANDSNSDADDEPSYSYADRRHMTAKDLLIGGSKLPSIVEPATNQDYNYDEYPSAWNPTSQLLVQSITQNSNEYTIDTHNQTKSSALPSNQVTSQNQKLQSNDVQDNPLPPKPKKKPTIKPRKKLTYKVTPNGATLHFSTGLNTAEKGDQPPSSGQVIKNQGKTDESGDSARLVARAPPMYMKLLETTKDDYHRYTYLFDGATKLKEQSVSDVDPERAHPNEWCKQTKC